LRLSRGSERRRRARLARPRPPGGPRARQNPAVDRRSGGSARRPRAGAGRLLSYAAVSGDRRGASAAGHAGGERRREVGGGATSPPPWSPDFLWEGRPMGQGLCRRRDQGGIRSSPGNCGSAKEPAARIAIHDAECLRTFMRGEYREAQEIAETMLREFGADAQGPEAGAFRRMLGLTRLYQGDLKAAQTIFERELTEFQLGPAGQVNAAAFLALTEWHLGEVERTRQHIQQAVQRASEMGDVATVGTALFFETVLESRRDDASATRLAADALLELSEKYGMRTYLDEGRVYASWARGRLLDPDFGADKLEQ